MKFPKTNLSKMLISLMVCTSFVAPAMAGSAITPLLIKTEQAQTQQHKQKIEVVFVLDTTGSMGGLIEGAKNKIWHIANEIQNAKTEVEVRIGLIAYRDRGDDYVTKHFSITNDIHSIYAELIEFRAGGGGDHPESVNQALYEAIRQQNWSKANDTLRMVFLVGDAPPKMNYQDDVKYMQSVKLANEKDIIINTILAGNDQITKRVWQEIAQNANGAFSQIAQDGNVTIIKTPYDDKIKQLNLQLNTTVILYGDATTRRKAQKVMESIKVAAPSASSDMAAYNLKRDVKNRVFSGKGDLLQDLSTNDAEIGSLIAKQLPTIMQDMDESERVIYINEMQEKRSKIQTQIDDLVKKRNIYKSKESKKLSASEKDSFDENLMSIIRTEAETKGILY